MKNSITFWYGDHQCFGRRGNSQKWVNILGNIDGVDRIKSASYQLNNGKYVPFNLGKNDHRLAKPGDFNLDIDRCLLCVGENLVKVSVKDYSGTQTQEKMTVEYYNDRTWPRDYFIDWNTENNIQDVVEVVDGLWEITDQGIHVVEPYYDRILAFGDSGWSDYEVTTTVIFHGYSEPLDEPPTYGVSHAAIAARWPGHHVDDHQPHIKWFPLGATCEFKLRDQLGSCRWRILDGKISVEDKDQGVRIQLGVRYAMKLRVKNLNRNQAVYQVKLWTSTDDEPDDWQLCSIKSNQEVASGSALLISHNTDVTFGNLSVKAL